MNNKDYLKMYREITDKTAKGIEFMKLEDYISALNNLSTNPDGIEEISLFKTAAMYSILGEKYSVRTVGEALGILRRGEVPEETIRSWIREVNLNIEETQSICKGYPHLKDEAQKIYGERIGKAVLESNKRLGLPVYN